MANYIIDLGIQLNQGDLAKVKTTINNLENSKKINLEINKKNIDSQLNSIRKQIQNLSNIKINLGGNGKGDFSLDTSEFKKSIDGIKTAVVDLQKILGSLGDNVNMKDLLASVNQIANAIGKVTDESETLTKSLSALSKKDFGFNFNLKTGGVNPTKLMTDYGQAASRKSIPAIKEQINYLKDLINKTTDADKALNNYLFKQNKGFAGTTLKQSLENQLLSGYDSNGKKVSKSDRMLAGEELIGYYKEIAALNNISLDGFNAKFSKSAAEIVDDTTKIQTGAKQTEEALESVAREMKQVFGGGIGAEQLAAQLDPIVADLNQIREAVQNLSKGVSLEGLTSSFDRLSNAIETLVQNATLAKQVLGDSLGGVGGIVDGGSTEEATQDQRELAQTATQTANAVVQGEEKKQRAYRETADESKKAVDASLSKEVDKINKKLTGSDLGFSKYDNEIDNVTTKFNKLENQSEQLQSDMKLLNSTFADIKTSSAANDVEALVGANREYEQVLTRVKNQLDINSRAQKEAAAIAKKEAAETAKAQKEAAAIANKMQKEADAAALKETNAELKKLKDLSRQIGQLDFKVVKSDYNDEIEKVREFERQLELVKKQYNETAKTLSAKGIDIGDITTPEFVKARNDIAEFEAQIKVTKRELAEKLKVKLETGDFTTQVLAVEKDAKRLSNTYEGVESGIEEVNAALRSMQSASADGDIERLINANKEYEAALKKVENQLKQLKIAQKDFSAQQKQTATQQKLDDDIILFQTKIDSWLTKNSAAAKQFGSQMLDLKAKAEGCDRTTLNHLEAEFKQVDRAAEAAGKKAQTFGDRLKTQFSKYSAYFGVAEIFMYAEQGLRDMFEQVKLIDAAMTELKKVTDETDASYNQFLSNAASRSKELGTTIDGLVSSTADFARLGYSFEDSQGLAEVANVYAVVGDEIEGVEGATESLISTMAAFKDSAKGMSNSDFAMSIIDKFNEIGKLIA